MATTSVIHVAGQYDPQTKLQRCARCRFVLKDLRIRGIDFPADGAGPLGYDGGTAYPVGAFIERWPAGQAMSLTATEATCTK